MSVLSAINTALSGLKAEATRLGSISNNIADASTVGYKKADTQFESLVLDGGVGGSTTLGGVSAYTRMDISTAGQVQATGVSTDIAVNGGGFMVVNSNANPANGTYLVTRAGSFRPDANGNLVNAGGFYLQGQPLDTAGNPTGGAADSMAALSTVNVANLSVANAPTTTMTFTANLPSADTEYAAGAPSPSTTSVPYYDPLGSAQSLDFQFIPTLPGAEGLPATNAWTMNIFDSASTTPTAPVGSATLTFNGTGANAGLLQSVTSLGAGTYDAANGTYTVTTASGQAIPVDIGALNSPGGMTQFDGAYTTTNLQQDGSSFGLLQGVSIGDDGKVIASFSNGATRPIYQLELAMFANPDGLAPVSGGAYALTQEAGVARLMKPGDGAAGTTQGGALEGSNVDISTELTNLIETQRAYSSTATVIQIGNQMLDVVNNLNR